MPTVYFPQLNNAGMITQRPYKEGLCFNTSVAELDCGKRITWAWRSAGLTGFSAQPLATPFTVGFSAITDAELAVLSAFFHTMAGRYGEFIFLDPHGNLVNNSEDFSDATVWTSHIAGTTGQADPFRGTRAVALTLGTLTTSVLPLGSAAGFVLNGSVWVKGTAGNVITISFSDGSSTATTLGSTGWTRVEHTHTISGSSAVTMSIAGSAAVTLFGAQCVPGPGAGGYMRTPGKYGHHPKCRFDQDSLQPRYVGPNEISLTVQIAEYA